MLNATLLHKIDITNELAVFQVKPDSGVPDFHPGQYLALGLMGDAPRFKDALPEKEAPKPDKLIKRAYSIGSAPSQKEFLEFYIAIVPDGLLTSRLAVLKEGDRLYVAPKVVGEFTLEGVPENANLVLVATGTGLAPYIAMLRSGKAWREGRRITVVHGVRFVKDLAYGDELRAMAAENSQLVYHPVVSRETPPEGGTRGHLQSLFSSGAISTDPTKDHVFLCGNPAMVEDMEKYLLARAYTVHSRKSPGALHLEKYW